MTAQEQFIDYGGKFLSILVPVALAGALEVVLEFRKQNAPANLYWPFVWLLGSGLSGLLAVLAGLLFLGGAPDETVRFRSFSLLLLAAVALLLIGGIAIARYLGVPRFVLLAVGVGLGIGAVGGSAAVRVWPDQQTAVDITGSTFIVAGLSSVVMFDIAGQRSRPSRSWD